MNDRRHDNEESSKRVTSPLGIIKKEYDIPDKPELPALLWIGVTGECNAHCIMCRDACSSSQLTRVMPIETYKHLIDITCAHARFYILSNFGESLILPDFKERIRYVSERKQPQTVLEIHTNGMLLNADMAGFLADHDVRVLVSFDSAHKHTFEAIRRGTRFETVCENLARFATLCGNKAATNAGINIAVQKDNWQELPDIVNLVHTLGARRLSFCIVTDPPGFVPDIDQIFVEKIGQTISRARSLSINVSFFPQRLGDHIWNGEKYVLPEGLTVDTRCTAPDFCCNITWNGDVGVCCEFVAKMGNINEQELSDIWQGHRFKSVRSLVNSSSVAALPTCKRCLLVNRL